MIWRDRPRHCVSWHPHLASAVWLIVLPNRQIRARHDGETVRVYQAYGEHIAGPAVGAQRFVSPFRMGRMTWVKPSFCWMMYRCGFASKAGQERVLAIDVSREGFDWALTHAALSHFDPAVHASPETWEERRDASPVRVQWDPERDIMLRRLEYRSIQIGLSGEAARRYVEEWTVRIADVTDLAVRLRERPEPERQAAAAEVLEQERPYPMPEEAAGHLLPRE